jgi:hypothetical protein
MPQLQGDIDQLGSAATNPKRRLRRRTSKAGAFCGVTPNRRMPRTLVEEFARIKSGDVVLPTVRADGSTGKTLRIRCVVQPDEYQRVFLSRPGLNLPERLGWMEETTPAQAAALIQM